MDRRKYLKLAGTGMIVGLAGCSGEEEEPEQVDGEETNTETQKTTEEETTEETTEEEPEEVTASVGELVSGDQMSLVVENVERGVELGGFYDPDSGNEFALASIALKNTSNGYTNVSNLLQTRIRDDENYQYQQTFASGEGATFNDGQFAPGEVERGEIPFEIPKDASGLKLIFDFDPSIFGGINRARIDLESRADQVHQLEQDLEIETYDVGDSIEYGDVEVALNEMRTETSLGQYTEADSGKEYVIVDISITNETGEEKYFSTILQMMLKDGEGYTYQEDLMATSQLDRAFDEGTPLSDGETRRGKLVYEVESGLTPLYWVFEFAVFVAGDKTFWKIR